MAKMASPGFCVALVMVVMVFHASFHQTQSAVILVGDNNGWTNVGEDYVAWAASVTVRVNDTLVFVNKNTYEHTVDILSSQSDYNNCTFTSNATPVQPGTNVTVTVAASYANGMFYAACTIPGHCLGGMKIAVSVQPALSGSSQPPPPPPPSPPPPPTATNGGTPTGAASTVSASSCCLLSAILVVLATFLSSVSS